MTLALTICNRYKTQSERRTSSIYSARRRTSKPAKLSSRFARAPKQAYPTTRRDHQVGCRITQSSRLAAFRWTKGHLGKATTSSGNETSSQVTSTPNSLRVGTKARSPIHPSLDLFHDTTYKTSHSRTAKSLKKTQLRTNRATNSCTPRSCKET